MKPTDSVSRLFLTVITNQVTIEIKMKRKLKYVFTPFLLSRPVTLPPLLAAPKKEKKRGKKIEEKTTPITSTVPLIPRVSGDRQITVRA